MANPNVTVEVSVDDNLNAEVIEEVTPTVNEPEPVVVEEIVDPVTPVEEDIAPVDEAANGEKIDSEKETDEKVTELESKIEKLTAELEKANVKDEAKDTLDQVNTLLKTQTNLVSEYEVILTGIIDTKLAEVPDNLKALVPENITLQQKIDWINKAEKTGIFKAKDTDIEIGRPLNPNINKQVTDTSKLSASTIMSMAYGSSNGRNKK